MTLVVYMVSTIHHRLQWREALLWVIVFSGCWVFAIVELGSLAGFLSFGPVFTSWVVFFVFLIAFATGKRFIFYKRPEARALTIFQITLILALVCITGLVAYSAVPLTYDSLTYHLPRVMHWAQNASVEFYSTNILRQLYQSPWAEYGILNLFILSGNDQWFNVLQWICMVLCIISVSYLAKLLGANRSGQLFAALLCATIPMGILQATTTQNDYALSLWLVCLAVFLLKIEATPGPWPVVGAGLSLGLAILTKGTSYIFAAPLSAFLLLRGVNRSFKKKVIQAAGIIFIALALNLPHYIRNTALFGSPLGPGKEGTHYTYTNEEFTFPVLLSNLARNTGMHLGSPWAAMNDLLNRYNNAFHRLIQMAPDDIRNTWPETKLNIGPPVAHEDLAGNGIHMILIIMAFFMLFFQRNRKALWYSLSLLVGFLLFSFLLRWQPWHSRLMLPLFVLASAMTGKVFQKSRVAQWIITIMVLISSYYFINNQGNSLRGEQAIWMLARKEQRLLKYPVEYIDTVQEITSIECEQLGLDFYGDAPEYLVWALLADKGWKGKIKSIGITNISSKVKHPGEDFPVCAGLRLGGPLARLNTNQKTLPRVFSRGALQFYRD